MDVYLERIVAKKKSLLQSILPFLYFAIAGVLTFMLFPVMMKQPILSSFSVLIIAALFYGAWYLSKKTNIEYEYILTNDELDVDKIFNKSTRKRILTVSVKKFDEMRPAKGKAFSDALSDSSYAVKLDASFGEGSEDRYYASFINKKDEKMLLVFNPTEQMLKNIKMFNPRNVFLDEAKEA